MPATHACRVPPVRLRSMVHRCSSAPIAARQPAPSEAAATSGPTEKTNHVIRFSGAIVKMGITAIPIFRCRQRQRVTASDREATHAPDRRAPASARNDCFLISYPEPGVRGRRRASRVFAAATPEAKPSRRNQQFCPVTFSISMISKSAPASAELATLTFVASMEMTMPSLPGASENTVSIRASKNRFSRLSRSLP